MEKLVVLNQERVKMAWEKGRINDCHGADCLASFLYLAAILDDALVGKLPSGTRCVLAVNRLGSITLLLWLYRLGVNMHAEFRYTFDDYREANLVHQRYITRVQQEEVKRRQKAFSFVSLLQLVALGAVFVVIKGLLHTMEPGGSLGSVQNLWLKFLGPGVAYCIMWIGIGRIVRRQEDAGMRVRKTPEERKRFWKALAGWIMFIGLWVLLYVLLRNGGGTRTPVTRARGGEDLAVDAVVVFGPWVVMIIIAWGLAWWMTRGTSAMRKVWEGTPAFHRLRTLDADEGRMGLDDGVSRFESQWVAFTDFQESENVFLLYTGKFAFHFIPKRALSAGQQEEFRQLAMSRIEVGPRHGFPVLPVKVDTEKV